MSDAPSILESVVLGVVQGLTEFLPVSSSGHLVAAQELFGGREASDLTREVMLHSGTLLAVVVVFRSDLATLLRGIWAGGAARMRLVAVGVGIVPAGIAGLLWRDEIASVPQRWPLALPFCWIVMAGILFSLREVARWEKDRDVLWGTALWVGCFQAVALLPGISRSGITIAAALWIGVRRQEAATFSFVMSVPLIAGATLMEIPDLVNGDSSGPTVSALVGGVVAFASGYLALKLLLGMLRRGSLHRWSYYLLGIAVPYAWWVLG